MDFSVILSFIGVSMLITIAPGPDNLFVVAQSITHGRKAGVTTALGLCSGITVHTLAAALGISAVLYQSDIIFRVIKFVGAFYLLYLSWQAIREGTGSQGAGEVEKQSLPSLYRKGIFMNVLNPKVALFFLAFLPQFISPNSGNMPLQMIALGLIFMLQAIFIFTLIALFAGSLGRNLLNKPQVARYINFTKAGIFTLIGIRLAFAEK